MILASALALFGLGLTAAVILGIASKVLYVKEDPRIAVVEDLLPGANCGGCGFPGCAGAAAAIVAGKAMPNVCVVADAEVGVAVASVMGMEVSERETELAWRDCTGGGRAEVNFIYEGAHDCVAAHQLYGGDKMCPEGCLGLGSCVRVCPFDALHMGPDGLPIVDKEACKACRKCEEICPRGVMHVDSNSTAILHVNETSDCLAPCRQKCPGQINIPKYIEHVRRGEYALAALTIKERNPLLLVCGRVCPRPCETVCRRKHVDEPVAINMLKRFAADYEMNSGEYLPIPIAPETGRKIAIVGGGPAGLSAAYYLRRLGHTPVIFEMMPYLGGQLRYGIPEYRLPKKVLDWEIEGILRLGVDVQLNKRFGKDYDLESLRADGYDAIFLGIGAWLASSMRCEGDDAEGVYGGIEFLTAHALGEPIDLGRKVVVVGGGNTAIDCARTCVRLGADVTLMYRRTRAEMPANPEEIVGAEEEGVKFLFLAAPKRVVPDENGRATGLEYVEMELGEPDASGRRRPTEKPGSETFFAADAIISAIGQKPDITCLYDDSESCPVETTKWATIMADPDTFETIVPGVFTAGDVYTGPDLVISAVGDGRKAARSIHYHLTGDGEIPVPEKMQRELIGYTLFRTVENVHQKDRSHMPLLCHGDDRNCTFFEVEGALSEAEARAEAQRCLRCGLTCYDRDENPEVALDQVARGRVNE